MNEVDEMDIHFFLELSEQKETKRTAFIDDVL